MYCTVQTDYRFCYESLLKEGIWYMANWRGGHILNILITFAHICACNGGEETISGGGDFSPMRPVCNTAHTNKQTQLDRSWRKCNKYQHDIASWRHLTTESVSRSVSCTVGDIIFSALMDAVVDGEWHSASKKSRTSNHQRLWFHHHLFSLTQVTQVKRKKCKNITFMYTVWTRL